MDIIQMKKLGENTIETMAVSSCAVNSTLDTFLMSRLDGRVGRRRKAVIAALLDSYMNPTLAVLNSLFERSFDYGRMINKLSLSPELKKVIITSAQKSIPAHIIEKTYENKVFLPQEPISQLMESTDHFSETDWSQMACFLGISAGILSLQNFEGVDPSDTLPTLDNNPNSQLLSTRNTLINQLINSPKELIEALLPNVTNGQSFQTALFVIDNLLSDYTKTRIIPLINRKRDNRVSYTSEKGNRIYSRWSVYYENPQRREVQGIFPEISVENKRQFYKKASALARIQLTKDVLQRDIKIGFIPPEIIRLINEYLLCFLDTPSFKVNLPHFVETQTSLLEKTQFTTANERFETIADFRDTALQVAFVSKGIEKPSTPSSPENQKIGEAKTIELGARTLEFLPDYKVKYPQTVVDALEILYEEYNQAFTSLIQANREWNTDYQYCIENGAPTNFMVQVDMVGLDENFLNRAINKDPKTLADELRGKIFEIENSIADYRYLNAVGVDIRPVLEDIRKQFQLPIVLLATTQRKYGEMRVAEFGEERNGEIISREKVRELSGFDEFWGPEEYENFLNESGGKDDYLLYIRSSAPKTQLRNPREKETQPLISDPILREKIKAHAITFNIDDPNTSVGGAQRINDTKLYMPLIGMGYPLYCITDLKSQEFMKFCNNTATDKILRAKPALESYGGYGQIRGRINPQFTRDLNSAMQRRGPYIIQDEKPYSRIIDENGTEYVYIDRNYLGICNRKIVYLGGERTLMPISAQEAINGRVHANKDAILANISIRK